MRFCLHPSFAKPRHETAPTKGGGAPKGASSTAAPHSRMLPSAGAAGAARATLCRCCHPQVLRARSPCGAPSRLSASHRMLCLDPGRASRDEVRRRYLRLWTALKPSTWLAGRNAGGDDARTARKRLARPPAGTALAPLFRSHPESALRRARCVISISSRDTRQEDSADGS